MLLCCSFAQNWQQPGYSGEQSDETGRLGNCCIRDVQHRRILLIARLDPTRKPLYVLLPKAEYAKLRAEWKLP